MCVEAREQLVGRGHDELYQDAASSTRWARRRCARRRASDAGNARAAVRDHLQPPLRASRAATCGALAANREDPRHGFSTSLVPPELAFHYGAQIGLKDGLNPFPDRLFQFFDAAFVLRPM